ncbi:MAG: tRNA (adenosine(37)-N6)-threonylcarbamoyltransferase complex dimerization subunit type 1 TsaB [Myxococcales bacterium]|nr:tRNA (adenosine(37)-N6)-threonylcarbamoyltransferase complex dimerization subunit type 1 TsaB [Myxococcales bacterium]
MPEPQLCCLALDTSSRCCSVALLRGEDVLAARAVEAAPAEVVLGLVDEVLAEGGVPRGALELLAVGLGPGGFTSTRVGVATAKGMALALGRPLLGVGSLVPVARASLDLGASATRTPGGSEGSTLGVLVDAGRGEVYGAAYALGVDVAAVSVAPFLAAPQDALTQLAAFPCVASASLGLDLPSAASPSATWIGREAVRRWRRGDRDALDALEPAYVRPSDAKLPTSPLRVEPTR